jgi:hypothetical protein
MSIELSCAWCLLKKTTFSTIKPAVTILNGTALCDRHLLDADRESRVRK